MILKNLSEWLFPGDGEGETAAPAVRPEIGAAALLVAAAHRDGGYTDIERDLVNAALMKLFLLSNPEAKALRAEAEEELTKDQRSSVTFASAARKLDREDQEALISHLWRLVAVDRETVGESVFVSSVRDQLGFTRQQADALKPSDL